MKNFAILGLIALIFITSSAFVRPGAWERLGTRSVTYKADYDEIIVTAREGRFDGIKIEVDRAPVDFAKVVVVYKRGKPEVLHFRDKILPGEETRLMNLRGNNRVIQKVKLYYKTPYIANKRAKVTVWGRH